MATADYYDSVISRVDEVNSCTALGTLQAEIEALFALQLASIQAGIDMILPIIDIPGADPGEIVEWITASVAPFMANYQTLLAEQILTIAKQAEAVAALLAKFNELGC